MGGCDQQFSLQFERFQIMNPELPNSKLIKDVNLGNTFENKMLKFSYIIKFWNVMYGTK